MDNDTDSCYHPMLSTDDMFIDEQNIRDVIMMLYVCMEKHNGKIPSLEFTNIMSCIERNTRLGVFARTYNEKIKQERKGVNINEYVNELLAPVPIYDGIMSEREFNNIIERSNESYFDSVKE